jgi:hypothetical protein
MQNSLDAANRLKALLDEMGPTNFIELDAQLALYKDREFMEKSIAILSSDNVDEINGLWREVQYLSRFFGGDYAQGSNQTRLLQLMNEFEEAVFEDIVSLRRTQI